MALYQLVVMAMDYGMWHAWLEKTVQNVPVVVFVASLVAYISWSVSSVLFRGLLVSTAVTLGFLYMRNASTSDTTVSKLKAKVAGIRSSLFPGTNS